MSLGLATGFSSWAMSRIRSVRSRTPRFCWPFCSRVRVVNARFKRCRRSQKTRSTLVFL